MSLPNRLALARIVMVPFFVLLLVIPIHFNDVLDFEFIHLPINQLFATLIFILASLTDFVDGKIARHLNIVTDFGKFIDPLADKMLVMSAFICLIGLNLAPSWIIAIIMCRELAVTGLRLIAVETKHNVIAANWPGKIKTTFQMLSIIFLLLNLKQIGNILLYICLFFTIYSGLEYFIRNRNVFSNQ